MGVVEFSEAIEVGSDFQGADMGPQVREDELQGNLNYIEVGEAEGRR